MTTVCPHCSGENPGGSAFCQACGKALPSAAPTAPRILSDKDFATTSAGVKLQADELRAQAKKAANALLTVAILQTIAPLIILLVMQNIPRRGAGGAGIGGFPVFNNTFFMILFGVAAIFWGLYFWARHSPLPAAIAGLVFFVTLKVIDFIMVGIAVANAPPAQSGSSPSANNPGGAVGGIWISVFIIIMLVRAIQAGIKHRQLMRMQDQPLPVVPVA